jgi:hypothetical protein
LRVGGSVRLELRMPGGQPMTVEMAKAEIDAMGVGAGDRVYVDLGHAKVFLEDYSI